MILPRRLTASGTGRKLIAIGTWGKGIEATERGNRPQPAAGRCGKSLRPLADNKHLTLTCDLPPFSSFPATDQLNPSDCQSAG